MKHQNKKHFGNQRFVFFAEVPQFSEGELEGIKKAKGEEKEELKIADLVNAVNGEVNKHSAQLAELPKEYNDKLHNEIKAYLERSTGRYEKDEVKGLSGNEFSSYVAAMQEKVKEMMKDWAPTEEDIKAKKEAQEKAKTAKESAEKVMPKEQREKILEGDPSNIKTLDELGTAFSAYDQAQRDMQQDAMKVLPEVAEVQKNCAAFNKARSGLKAYKQFSAYLFPENDQERINLQTALATAKSNVKKSKEDFVAAQKKLKEYGDKLGNVSNKLKEDKMAERDKRYKELDEKGKEADKKKEEKQQEYKKLQDTQVKLVEQRQKLGTHQEELEKAQKEKEQKVLLGQDGREQLSGFQQGLYLAVQQIDTALQNPNLSDEQRKKLEDAKKDLEQKISDVQIGVDNAGETLAATQTNINELDEGKKKIAAQSLNIGDHLEQQVKPGLDSIDQSIAALEEEKMKYSTDKDELGKYYENVFKSLDGVDVAIDDALLKNNMANAQIEKSLDDATKALDKIDIAPPSGIGGAIEATVGVPFRMIGGGIGAVGEALTDAGKWMAKQGEWLSNELEMNKDSMGSVAYGFARAGVEIVNFPIGAAAGLTEMAGGLLTLVGEPVQTVKGLLALVGRDPATGEWTGKTAGNTWKNMGKAIICYEDFEKGHIGLALGKIFPNVVITITTAGSVQAGKLAGQAAFLAAREAGAGVASAIGRGTIAFGRAAAADLATTAKNIPGNLKTFVVGGEGKANVIVRTGEGLKAVGAIDVGEAASGAVAKVKGAVKGKKGGEFVEQPIPLVQKAGNEPLPLVRKKGPKPHAEEPTIELHTKDLEFVDEGTVFELRKPKAKGGEPTIELKTGDIEVIEPPPKAKAKPGEPTIELKTGDLEPVSGPKPKPKSDHEGYVPAGGEEATGARSPMGKERKSFGPSEGLEAPSGAKDARVGSGVDIFDFAEGKTRVLSETEKIEHAKAYKGLSERLAKDAQLNERIGKAVAQINDRLPKGQKINVADLEKILDPAEMKLLTETSAENLSQTVISKVIKREFDMVEDVVRGQKVSVRVYIDDSANVGAGGIGKVNEGCFVVWEGEGIAGPGTKLERGAVKVNRPTDSAGVKLAQDEEIAALRAVRDLPDQFGLLEPSFVGKRRIVKPNGEVVEEIVTITKKIEKYEGTESAGLDKLMGEGGPEFVFSSMDSALTGLETFNGQVGRMHLDIKPGNIFVGTVDGKPVAVLGDLAGIPYSEMKNVRFLRGKIEPPIQLPDGTILKEMDIPHRLMPNGDLIQIPVTPTYFNNCAPHMRALQAWMEAHPNVPVDKIPGGIRSLPDLGQWGFMMKRYRAFLDRNPNVLPAAARQPVMERMNGLIAKLDDVPDFASIQARYEAAVSLGDAANAQRAAADMASALQKLESRIDIAAVQKELREMQKIVENAKAAAPQPLVSP